MLKCMQTVFPAPVDGHPQHLEILRRDLFGSARRDTLLLDIEKLRACATKRLRYMELQPL